MSTVWGLISNTVKLFSLPEVYFRLKDILDDPHSSMNDMAAMISHDPGLTARVLRVANSAFFGFRARIETIHQATNVLGTQQVHDLALATSVTGAFASMSSDMVNMSNFWRNSVSCGLASRLLAEHCNALHGERLFIAGLLHDIGHLVMYQLMPAQMQQILLNHEQQNDSLFLVERELLGFDYAQVGSALMQAWGLPNSLQEATAYHPEPGNAKDCILETAIVHIATHITSSDENSKLSARDIDPFAWHMTALTPEIFEMIAQQTRQQLDETMSLFFN